MEWSPVDGSTRIAGTLHVSLLKIEIEGADTIESLFGTQRRYGTIQEMTEQGLHFPILHKQVGRSFWLQVQNEARVIIGSLYMTAEDLFVGVGTASKPLPLPAPTLPKETDDSSPDDEEDAQGEEIKYPEAAEQHTLLNQPQWFNAGKGRILLKGTFFPPPAFSPVAKRPATNPRKHAHLYPVYMAPIRQKKSASPGCWLCRKKFSLIGRRRNCRICGLLCCRDCLNKHRVDTGKDIESVFVCLGCSNTFEAALYISTWEADEASHSCRQCSKGFTILKRRSHCRICGFVFCSPCLNLVSVVDGNARGKAIKACQCCTKRLQQNAKGLCWEDSVDRVLYQLDLDHWPPAEGDFAEDTQQENKVPEDRQVPALNVLILIVGSRGDVQPFIPLAHKLLAYGHRVRLATHECFRQFVTSQGIEFFPLGGDPKELMAYMVKTGGRLLPHSIKEIKEDVPAKRTMIGEIMHSTWLAATSNEEGDERPLFIADSIISNPPTYGHIHVAEALCIPLHLFFTMPWNPTRAFPHPMANLDNNKGESNLNYRSFQVIDHLMWAGTSDLVNDFRKSIDLDPILMGENGSGLLSRVSVPFAYMWSPALIPKPKDWGPTIDVVGFSFLAGSGAGNWTPPQELLDFLAAGPPPIFVGFGSCVIPDPQGTTKLIYEAAKRAGVRLILQRGWANLGGPFDKKSIEEHKHHAAPTAAPHAVPAASSSSSSSSSSSVFSSSPPIILVPSSSSSCSSVDDSPPPPYSAVSPSTPRKVSEEVLRINVASPTSYSCIALPSFSSSSSPSSSSSSAAAYSSSSSLPTPGSSASGAASALAVGAQLAFVTPASVIEAALASASNAYPSTPPAPSTLDSESLASLSLNDNNHNGNVPATTAALITSLTTVLPPPPPFSVSSPPPVTPPSNIYVIGDAPHDWLFKQCRAVCHHGGAGTTAAGLLAGLPTIIVPFFGDQPFWGAMVAKQGSGPVPIPFAELSADLLTDAFTFVGRPECVVKAKEMSARMEKEDGASMGLQAFHSNLPVEQMSCDVLPEHCAKVFCEECGFKLCPLADYVLHCMGERTDHERSVYRYVDWRNREAPTGAGSGVGMALSGAAHQLAGGIGDALVRTGKGIRHADAKNTVFGVGDLIGSSAKAGVILVDRMGKGFSRAGGDWTVRPENLDPHLHPNQHSHLRVQHAGDGIMEGGKSLISGIVDGIGGVVMEPMLAAKRGEGAEGVAKGFGKGLVGFFFKPAGGVLQLLSNVSIGVARTPAYVRRHRASEGKKESVTQKRLTLVAPSLSSGSPAFSSPTPSLASSSSSGSCSGPFSASSPHSSIINHQTVSQEDVAIVLSAYEAAKTLQARARQNIVRERRKLADGVTPLKQNRSGELSKKKKKSIKKPSDSKA